MTFHVRQLLSVVVILLCINTYAADAQQEMVWHHNTLSLSTAKVRFVTDRAECLEYTNRLAPLPQPPRASINPPTREITILTPNGPLLGIMDNPHPSYVPSLLDYADYQTALNVAKAQQEQIFVVCMAQRDWSWQVKQE